MKALAISKRSLGKVARPLISVISVMPIVAIGLLAAVTIGARPPVQPSGSSALADSSQNPVSDFFSVSSNGSDISLQVPGSVNNTPSDQSADQSTAPNTDQTAPATDGENSTGNVSISITNSQSFSTNGNGSVNSPAVSNSNSNSTSQVSINSTTNGNGQTTGSSSSFVIQNGKVVQNTHHDF